MNKHSSIMRTYKKYENVHTWRVMVICIDKLLAINLSVRVL